MKRKIRHALVQYVIKEDGKPVSFETAFRNQVVDIPDDQVARLDELGATVDPGEGLDRPGVMSHLSETASDEEIDNWVKGATEAELGVLIVNRPAMAGRLESAAASIRERLNEQNTHLGSVAAEDEEFAVAEEAAADEEEEDLLGGALSDEDADELVEGTAKSVTDYISENPDSASVLLDAEGRRAESKNEDVRVTIVNAAQAAAGFTQ